LHKISRRNPLAQMHDKFEIDAVLQAILRDDARVICMLRNYSLGFIRRRPSRREWCRTQFFFSATNYHYTLLGWSGLQYFGKQAPEGKNCTFLGFQQACLLGFHLLPFAPGVQTVGAPLAVSSPSCACATRQRIDSAVRP
jgi:hypothetical protein